MSCVEHYQAMPTKTAKGQSAAPPGKQLAAFIEKFDPAVAKLTRACFAKLRKRFPTANQLVYDNYNALAIGFCTTDRASDCIVSLAVTIRGPSLCFIYGAKLDDPKKLLTGGGNQVRFIRLPTASTVSQPGVESLIKAAIAQAKSPLPKVGKGMLIIKSVSIKQRPRR
jgi:hypothetical protein